MPRLSAFPVRRGGELEPTFNGAAFSRSQWLKLQGVAAEYHGYVAGHDPLLWQQALVDYLPGVFPPR